MDVIITKMVGRDLTHRFPAPIQCALGEVILKVENLTSAETKSFNSVTFDLHRGEILGTGGLVGAKRTELVESIFGIRPIESGTISLSGKPIVISSPQRRHLQAHSPCSPRSGEPPA
ncbi:MAG: hypothetical protein MZU79_00295 [Anaerotruncus sp.]|nr:hypothetical protein [Anaerotruncus sp.]